MNSQTDQQLLRDYAVSRSETAFAEIVRRHVDFVYSAALRMVRDAQLAEDVTQDVFLALVRREARQLTDRPVLSGWLHRTTQNLAANAVRGDVRRRVREQEAAAMNELLSTESDVVWEHIAPYLDDALGELNEGDRDALLLRYFERKTAREMAETLGTSEEAAQKRVSRAVERLREFFAKRGITVGASGLAVVITANAVQAAPIGLSAAITGAAALAGTTIATTATATKAIVMTTIQKTLVTTIIAAGVVTPILIQSQALVKLRAENQSLRQQDDQLAQLQLENQRLTDLLAQAKNSRPFSNNQSNEVLRLRGKVGVLQRELESLAKTNLTKETQTAADKRGADPLAFGETQIIVPVAELKDAGLNTPEATAQTYLWTRHLAADTNSNAQATEKLRELLWFPPGFDRLKYAYSTRHPNSFEDIKFLKIRSVAYTSPTKARVVVDMYGEASWIRGTEQELIKDGQSWKVLLPSLAPKNP